LKRNKNGSLSPPHPQILQQNAEFVIFFYPKCTVLEVLQTPQSLNVSPNISRLSQLTGNKVSKSYSKVAKQLLCSLFNGSDRHFKCDEFVKMQVKKRFDHAKQSGPSFNCLHTFTNNHTCSKQVCRQCHNRQHTFLHKDRQIQTINE